MSIRGKEQKFQQVKSDIEFKIIMGEYKVGERIPSIRTMEKEYPIGSVWARNILEKMCQEKIVILEPGKGYKVSDQAVEILTDKYTKEIYDAFLQACEDAVKIGIDPVKLVQEIMNSGKIKQV